MATRSFRDIATKNREKWSPSTHNLAQRLSAQLEAETTAQEALGRQLAEARKLAHLTQPQLAQQTGLQQADISRIEHGLGNPTRDTLLKLVDALGMEIVLRPKEGETKVQI